MSHYDTGPGDWPASSIPPHERVTDEELAGALDRLYDEEPAVPEPAPDRLAEIRSKPFGDLTPDEMLTWSAIDPREYYAAAKLDARRMVEREAEAARRRGAERRRERMLSVFRRLARLLGGGRRG